MSLLHSQQMNQYSKLDTIDIVDPKYQNTIVYGIICLTTGEMYVGSCITSLNERMKQHRTSHATRAHQIIERGNYQEYEIQRWPCNTLREVLTIEGDWQRAYKACFPEHLVNKRIEGQFVSIQTEKNRVPWKCWFCKKTTTTGRINYHKKICRKWCDKKAAQYEAREKAQKVRKEAREKAQKARTWTCEWCNKTLKYRSSHGHKKICKYKPV